MTRPLSYQPGSDPTEMIEEWLARPALREMVEAFGGQWPVGDLAARLQQLVDFSTVWDRRGGNSRLNITTTGGTADQQGQMLRWAAELGLIDVAAATPRVNDAVLVLGGLVTGCVSRVDYLSSLLTDGQVHTEAVVLLGSFRPLQDQEQQLVEEVAPGANAEVDVLMALGARLDPGVVEWGLTTTGDPVGAPALAELVGRREGRPPTWVFAARSSDPDRRPANTADTYRQAAGHLAFGSGTRLLLVTNQIYAVYQHWDAIRVLGLPFEVDLETIGTPSSASRREFPPEWYAQEVRSALRSARDLAAAWSAR